MSIFRKLSYLAYDGWDKVIGHLIDSKHDPKWNDLLFRLEYLPNEITYWTFHDNWHSAAPISLAMCWLGRHDFEAEVVKPAKTADVTNVTLFCLRCGQRKNSLCGNRK